MVKKMDEKIKELESEYENLLCEKGVEMVEGYGLEGDWDSMSDEEKIKALEGAIGYLQE
jgi:hypothetical protein